MPGVKVCDAVSFHPSRDCKTSCMLQAVLAVTELRDGAVSKSQEKPQARDEERPKIQSAEPRGESTYTTASSNMHMNDHFIEDQPSPRLFFLSWWGLVLRCLGFYTMSCKLICARCSLVLGPGDGSVLLLFSFPGSCTRAFYRKEPRIVWHLRTRPQTDRALKLAPTIYVVRAAVLEQKPWQCRARSQKKRPRCSAFLYMPRPQILQFGMHGAEEPSRAE